MYYKNLYKKEMIKNIIIIGVILFIAIFSTYHIYYSFGGTKEIDFSSASLDITFHEDAGEQLNITKVVPKTDSVGLASTGHKITIINNLIEDVNYKIKIVDNDAKIDESDCQGIIIPKEEIRVSIKEPGKETKIYSLSELENGVLLSTQAKALEKDKFTIRIWIKDDTLLPNGSKYHYHGLIQVIENDTTLAVK